MKPFLELPDNLYQRRVIVCICPIGDLRAVLEPLYPKCKFGDWFDENANGKYFSVGREPGNFDAWVWLAVYDPSSPASVAVLAHESFHAACHILRKAGVGFSKKSEEAYAYFFKRLFLDAMTALAARATKLSRAKPQESPEEIAEGS